MAVIGRRAFLRAAGLGALTMAMPKALAANADRAPLPNIVLILADDMGFGDLGCQNPESKIPTPNLDRLAGEGMRFTDAHSPSAVCTPTRYGILTGTYCWRSPLKQSVLWPWDGPLIAEDTLTLGGMLQNQGYCTACIGKWHLGWDWPTRDGSSVNDTIPLGKWDPGVRDPFGAKVDLSRPIGNGPTKRGFDYYFGDDVPNFAPYCFIENDRTVGIPTEQKPDGMFGTPGPMMKGWKLENVMPALTRKAVEYIKAAPGASPFKKKEGKPFFLYFPLTAPHTPIAPTSDFIGKSQAHRYGDYVNEVDWTVGQVLKALETSGQADNTLVLFTSDNGSPARDGENMAGAVGSVRKYGHNPSYIYRGVKADIWDGGHRVPFIVRWPGHVSAGTTCDGLVSSVDIVATCAALVDYALPDDQAVDSYNELPLLEGRTEGKPIREALVHHSISGMFAIRQGKWKLVAGQGSGGWSKDGTDPTVPGQLYDMQTDPEEKTNVYAENPDVVQRMTALLESYQRDGRSAPHRDTWG